MTTSYGRADEGARAGDFVLEREQTIARPRHEVFAFFSDAANLEQITPPFLGFHIVTPQPIEMKAGALIEYRIRLAGVPLRWKTLIEVFEPNDRFVDVQLRGPYRVWRHTHAFTDGPNGSTIMRDRVEYSLPFGPLGKLVRAAVVRRTLEHIFDYRREVIGARFPELH